MEETTSDGKLLGQDDIDALLTEAGLEGDNESEGEEEEASLSHSDSNIKDEEEATLDITRIIDTLCHNATLKREKGVQIIWNASKVFPMAAGLNLKIQGTEYTSLGVLQENHLVVTSNQ